ncbi:MAG: class I SAM-dependent RNA methyltransferase, partial [Treponema sp.]|nr:class I SAM-dependent RNA methyltransferase [Treponema sp.]
MQLFTAAALCAVGAEKIVSNELKKLGLAVLESGFGRVRFSSDLVGLYRSLMSLRAADRLLLEAGRFPAGDFDALFEGTRNIPWESLVPRNMGLKVGKVRCSRSKLKAETTVQAMVHKAAAGRLCAHYGMRRLPEPEGNKLPAPALLYRAGGSPVCPQAELRVYVEKDNASVLLDLSGEPLFKRGYRREGGPAPLRESTAAALLLLSGWKRKFPLYDPLCGSGTIIIEACLYAWDQAPGLGRRFVLSDLAAGDRRVEDEVRGELAARIDYGRVVRIFGSDADPRAVALAKANVRRAAELAGRFKRAPGVRGPGQELSKTPVLESLPLAEARPPTEDTGCIITNPPYGRRLGDSESAAAGYAGMAVLRENFPGWKLALICDHPGFESCFGKKA